MRMAAVDRREAGRVLRTMRSKGMVDDRFHILREDGVVLVPVLDGVEEVPGAIGYVEREPEPRLVLSPHRRIEAELDLDMRLLAHLPRKWELLGDVLVIRIPSELEDQKRRVAEAYAKVLGARTVVRDLSGIHGEYRRPEVEVLYGSDTRTVHREGGILYTMDVTKVMFASGNIDERERMGTIDCRGEVVVDMFAGIGYFTLPIAKKAGAKRVIACEKNPQSHAFLVENIRLNGVEDRVQTFLGDNRELPGEGFADRVVMGYVGTTRSFLPKGMSLCRSGGMIHFHDTYNVRDLPQGPISDIERAAKGRGFEVLQVREVKSYAPSVSHVVVDLRLD